MKLTQPLLCIMLVTFWEENSPSVFEDRFLRKILGLKREEVKGDWRKLHKEEPHDLQVYISHQTMLGRFDVILTVHRR